MSKNDELNTVLSHDEALWEEIEQEVSALYPREAMRLNALFVSRSQTVQKVQKAEAEGRQLSNFVLLLKTWFLQLRINKILARLNTVEVEA